jgi:hypothetical protein
LCWAEQQPQWGLWQSKRGENILSARLNVVPKQEPIKGASVNLGSPTNPGLPGDVLRKMMEVAPHWLSEPGRYGQAPIETLLMPQPLRVKLRRALLEMQAPTTGLPAGSGRPPAL